MARASAQGGDAEAGVTPDRAAWQAASPPLVLASTSPTRAALLRGAGLAFSVAAPSVDEEAVRESARADGATAEETAMLLADMKAAAVARSLPDALVIGADQILDCEGTWLGKPADSAAARAQLRVLRGRAHLLATGVACHRGGQRVWGHVESARLLMRDLTDAFLDAYLAHQGEAVAGSVGGYRLEAVGVQLFVSVDGEHAAVLGLPLLRLLAFLRDYGVLLR